LKTKFLLSLFFVTAFAQPIRANALSEVLLYNGTGSSPTDVVALEAILTGMHLTYDLLTSAQMNAIPKATMISYKMIVFPGGDSIQMGDSLTTATTALVKTAVSQYGVSYIGFCAGAFMAESSTLYNVFNLAGTWFDFYDATLIDMVWTTFPDGSQRDLVYWEGPYLTDFGSVIAKYPNGQSAIAESKVGKGFVLVSGVHPEAPADWRDGMAHVDEDGVPPDVAYAGTLLNAAYTQTMLPHF
jgi:hypothetical protein